MKVDFAPLSDEVVRVEDALYEAVQPVLDHWQAVRNNLCEALERRDVITLYPPGGRERALEELEKLECAELRATTTVAGLIASLARSDDQEA
jgi:hypothetical protein